MILTLTQARTKTKIKNLKSVQRLKKQEKKLLKLKNLTKSFEKLPSKRLVIRTSAFKASPSGFNFKLD